MIIFYVQGGNMSVQYIGITDFTLPSEVREMREEFIKNSLPQKRLRLMVGVMASYKTLWGLPCRWTKIFPPNDFIKQIFLQEQPLFNCIHYADYKNICVADSLEKVVRIGGKNLHAIQLDMIWPDAEEIIHFKKAHPELHIILQINTSAFNAVENDSLSLVKRLRSYGNSLNGVLLDKSQGQGIGLNEQFLRPFIKDIHLSLPNLGITIAGGLGPETLHLAEGLIQEFSFLSIDAQAQLHENADIIQPMDWHKASLYLKKSLDLYM